MVQSCLVYINTLMLQRVLEEAPWAQRMTAVDMRGLTPLVYGHVSPYGSFELRMHERIELIKIGRDPRAPTAPGLAGTTLPTSRLTLPGKTCDCGFKQAAW